MTLKKLKLQLLEMLPSKLRSSLKRQGMNLEYSLDSNLSFEVVKGQSELTQAFRLLHDSYVEVGLMKPESNGMRITSYHNQATSIILVVKYFKEVIGTVTVVRDNSEGLPADKIYDLSALRKGGRTLAEMSGLAIKKEWRGKIFFPFLKYMIQTIYQHLGIDTVVAVAHSSWYQFYEDFLLFQPLEERMINNYSFANNMPVKGCFLELDQCFHLHSKTYAQLPLNKNLFYYFWLSEFEQFKFIDEKYFSIINPCYRSTLLQTDNHYSASNLKRDLRIASNLRGSIRIEGRNLPVSVLNLSTNGARLKLAPFQIGSASVIKEKYLTIDLQLGRNAFSRMKIEVVWFSKDFEMGVRIVEPDDNWNDYLFFNQLEMNTISNVTHVNFNQTKMNA